ncbi:MAG: LysR substrate-binding domain-containing protein, partial [Pseudomonadales bacterium]|nr:LysR substrate-binding domain-containing protein [Pseudomonadales bacterium]
GEITVSVSPFFSGTVLIPAMMRFEQEFPGYRLNIQTSNAFADLKNRQIDIAIRISRSKEVSTKRFHLLDVSSIPICPVQYLKGRHAIRRVEDFNKFPLIEVSFLKRAWPEWFADQGLEMPAFEKTIDMDTTVGIVDAVRSGVGIGLGIYPLVSRLSGYGTEFVAPFDLPGKVRTGFSAVVRKEIASQRKIVRFLDWLKEELQTTFGQ